MKKIPDNQIAFYQSPDGSVNIEVLYAEENIWLPQRRIAELFDSIFYQEFQSKNHKWENIKLEEVCEKIEQKNPRTIFKDSFSYIDIASIDKEHVIKAQTISVKNTPSRARKLVRILKIVRTHFAACGGDGKPQK